MGEKTADCCETAHHHYDMVSLWKDSTRLKIMCLLLRSEMCVCDIADVLNMNQSAISHQLRVLKQNKLVKNRREGKSVIYSLADQHVMSILSQGMEHISEGKE